MPAPNRTQHQSPRPSLRRLPLTHATLAVGLAALASTADAGFIFDTRALTQTQAPGAAPGALFDRLETPGINAHGDLAFRGFLAGPGVDFSNDSGLWLHAAGTLQAVQIEGTTAPGTDAPFGIANPPKLDDLGRVAFKANLETDFDTSAGLWVRDTNGTTTLQARAGDPAPGTAAGQTYSLQFGFPIAYSSSGQLAFRGGIVGTGVTGANNTGLWVQNDAGQIELAAREGDAAPGADPDELFQGFSPPTINRDGNTAFFASLTGPGINSANNAGLWTDRDGDLALLIREGDDAPGTSGRFITPRPPSLNDAGHIAFASNLVGSGVSSTNNSGIWSDAGGTLELIAREGDAAPGTDAVFGELAGSSLNGRGEVAFTASVTGPTVQSDNNSALWRQRDGSLELVAREADPTPLGNAITYGNIGGFAFNSQGLMVFSSTLRGDGIDTTNDDALWLSDEDGNVQLIFQAGDLFDANDDPLIEDLRTIERFNFAGGGGEQGQPTSLNATGQLAVRIEFTDDSVGIFTTTIPEPGAAALALAGGLGLLGRSPKRRNPNA
ncbi:MAG: choice-of-anchor tandem repeat NxxGxxAF-containing protein [Planctomycetota bacterium]